MAALRAELVAPYAVRTTALGAEAAPCGCMEVPLLDR